MSVGRSLFALFVLCINSDTSQAQDFTRTLADRLQTKAEYLVLNLPPRPAVWPGAIFSFDYRTPIVRGRKDDPALARGEPIEVDVTDLIAVGAATQAGARSWLSVGARAADATTVTMSFPDLRVIDILLDEATKRAQQWLSAHVATKQGPFSFIVVKSYEGTPTITIKKANASATAMADIRKAAAQAGLEASTQADDQVAYRTTAPIVLAFEVMRVMNDGGKTELATSSASTFYSHLLAQQEAEMKSLADQLLLRWPVRAK
jgi:hypothetical protein